MVQDPPTDVSTDLKIHTVADMGFVEIDADKETKKFLPQVLNWVRENGLTPTVSEERMNEFHNALKLTKGQIVFCITAIEDGKVHLWMLEYLVMHDKEIISDLGWEDLESYQVFSVNQFLF